MDCERGPDDQRVVRMGNGATVTRKPPPSICTICRKPTKSGHRYCGDHRDPRPLPTGDDMLRWIEAQQCPLCADGRTFRVLANHAVKAHGITGDDIRRAAGLPYEAPICAPEHSADQRELVASLGNLTHFQPDNPVSREQAQKVSVATGARMRAYKRLAELHRADYIRLLAEERGNTETPPAST